MKWTSNFQGSNDHQNPEQQNLFDGVYSVSIFFSTVYIRSHNKLFNIFLMIKRAK